MVEAWKRMKMKVSIARRYLWKKVDEHCTICGIHAAKSFDIHTQAACHWSTRIPHECRCDIVLHRSQHESMLAAVSDTEPVSLATD